MIRKAVLSDLAAVVELCENAKENMICNGILQWDEAYPKKQVFAQDIAEGNLFLMVAEDALLLGCAVLNDSQDVEYGEIDWQYNDVSVSVIHRLMVNPKAEGKGAAYALLQFAEQEAARRACGAIRLDAFAKNERALRLYERNGYNVRGTIELRKGTFYCFEKKL